MVNFSPVGGGGPIQNSFETTISEGGPTLIASLIGVPMTESRMGRSRGKITLVRIAAPIGVIGFFGVLKVHLASFISEKLAKELNLSALDMASASRVGSIRGMNAHGVSWDEKVDRLETRVDRNTYVRVDADFPLDRDAHVSYISTRQNVVLVRKPEGVKNNRKRLYSILGITFGQAVLSFGVSIGSEFASKRQHSLALFFAASLVLTETISAVTEWIYTTQMFGDVIIGRYDPHLDNTQSPREEGGNSLSKVNTLRIFEQKRREAFPTSPAIKFDYWKKCQLIKRHYKIRRMTQLSVNEDEDRRWLINSNLPVSTAYLAKTKLRVIQSVYLLLLIGGLLALVTEAFIYGLYLTTRFSSINSFGKWFAVQLGAFVLKGISPWLDEQFGFEVPKDKAYFDGLVLGDDSSVTGESAQRGHVRAANAVGLLMQTMENRSTLPAAPASMARFSNNTVVVPPILFVSGTNVLSHIQFSDEDAPRWNTRHDPVNELCICQFMPEKEWQKKCEKDEKFRESQRMEKEGTANGTANGKANGKAERGKKGEEDSKEDQTQIEEESEKQVEPTTKLSADENKSNKDGKSYLKENEGDNEDTRILLMRIPIMYIREDWDFKIVTELDKEDSNKNGSKEKEPHKKENEEAKSTTRLVMWDSRFTEAKPHAIPHSQVLTFSLAHVNDYIKEPKMLLHSRSINGSVYLPNDWKTKDFSSYFPSGEDGHNNEATHRQPFRAHTYSSLKFPVEVYKVKNVKMHSFYELGTAQGWLADATKVAMKTYTEKQKYLSREAGDPKYISSENMKSKSFDD